MAHGRSSPDTRRCTALNEDRAAVCVSDGKPARGTPPTQLCGAVDADGKLAVPFRSWKLGAWVDGTALMSEGGKSGFVDKDGKIIGGRLFDDAQRSETEGLGKVLLDGKWVGLDRQGRIVAILDDHKVIATCPSGVKLIREADKVEVVGVDGKPTVPYLLDYTHNRLDCDKPSAVRLGGEMGLSRHGWASAGRPAGIRQPVRLHRWPCRRLEGRQVGVHRHHRPLRGRAAL